MALQVHRKHCFSLDYDSAIMSKAIMVETLELFLK